MRDPDDFEPHEFFSVSRDHPHSRIARQVIETPAPALSALREAFASQATGVAYRGAVEPEAQTPSRWWPVIIRDQRDPGASLLWPAMRTVIPAGFSAALVVAGIAASLSGLALSGVVLGSVLSAMIARTQYKLEEQEDALSSLWISTRTTHLLVARFDSLGNRLRSRPQWKVFPLSVLERVSVPRVPMMRLPGETQHAALAQLVLNELGVGGVRLDPWENERLYTLVRLARWKSRIESGAL